jgi:pectinesterase
MIKLYLILFILINTLNLSAQQQSPPQYKYKITVAKDGTGDYIYIQDAIDAMRVFATEPIIVYIKNGIYNEKIELPATKTDVSFIGESVEKTIITFNDHTVVARSTPLLHLPRKLPESIQAENITFANAAGPVGQAVALHVESDKAVFKNCVFSATRIPSLHR